MRDRKANEAEDKTEMEVEVALTRDVEGYHSTVLDHVEPGTRYMFRLDDKKPLPDPASRFQPETVHGPSEVVESAFAWTDHKWRGLPLDQFVIYELHVGTATFEGTFEALIPRLPALKQLGITALEIMPVAQFPGKRNWGYDGVFPFAVQNSYGGPIALKRLVNACHSHGLAVLLDVVYNHLGPEGNYLASFGRYFTDTYRTPWGAGINFDAEHSDHVRRYFLENAAMWQREFRFDGLRLDAVHAIRDFSAVPFLQDLARMVHRTARETGRNFYLIAESDLNDARLLRAEIHGGLGIDAQTADDFHHALHVLLTGEQDGYYSDYGGVSQLAKCLRDGYLFTGQHSRFRKRRHGNASFLTDPRQFVVFSQNHDQIGNRCLGERLAGLVGMEKLRLAAGAVILSPFTPMLFMGEEYGDTAPFQFFVDYTDRELSEAVRNGRREEFAAFEWSKDTPDPCAMSTFERSRLNYRLPEEQGRCAELRAFYAELLRLRRDSGLLPARTKKQIEAVPHENRKCLEVVYSNEFGRTMAVLFNFDEQSHVLPLSRPGDYVQVLDSADPRWGGQSQAARHQRIRLHAELGRLSFQVYMRFG